MQRPLGYLALAAIGLPLALGALVAVLARFVVFAPPSNVYLFSTTTPVPDAVDRIYLWASPALALLGVALLCRAWWRRRGPFGGPHGATEPGVEFPDASPERPPEWPPEWRRLALAAGCGVGLGFYTGALHHVDAGVHMSAVWSYFVLLPLAILAGADPRGWTRGLGRLVVLMTALELGVQVSHSLTQRHGLRYWSDWTGVNAGFFVGGCVLLLVLHRSGLPARTERLRPAALPTPAAEAPPRRA